MDAIKTAKLTKYYGKAKGIENLDLTVKKVNSLALLDRMEQVNRLRFARY